MKTKRWERKPSPIHRFGLFATEDIKKGTRLIEYKGRRVSPEEGDKILNHGGVYVFGLSKEFDVDGRPQWNPAGYINFGHDPNCRYKLTFNKETERREIWLITLRDIKAGEELTYQYDYRFDEGISERCNCGAAQCPGVMISVKDIPKLVRLLDWIKSKPMFNGVLVKTETTTTGGTSVIMM